MPLKVTDSDFINLWAKTGGSAVEVSKLSGISERSVHGRRRRLEERLGKPLFSQSPGSPDLGASPQPEFPDWQQLEIKNGLLIAFSDSHLIPHRKSTAHRALVKLVHELQPDALVDMGDLLDFASISRHHRIGWDRQLSVREEVMWAKDCLDELEEAGPKKMKKRRARGNHDQRFAGHISNNLSSYEGLKGLTLEDQLPGWPVSWAIRVNEHQLELKHRYKSGIHAPYNNAKDAGISYATGHLHSQKVYPLTDLRGDRWGVDVGCLAPIYGPHFRFMEAAPRNWRSGFALFRFVNYELRQPQLVRVVNEENRIVEYLDRDIHV